jgi:formylglycine-generating enzyme required for sulfatase activity
LLNPFEDGTVRVSLDLCGVERFQVTTTVVPWVHMLTVTVGNPGNAGENSGESEPGGYGRDRICGGVAYVYSIGKFEVTAGQYMEFLNAVAATDAYDLYNPSMVMFPYGCQITQNGASGSYTYALSGRASGTEADLANRPVNYISWGDAARFCNWLHNDRPTGAQDLTTTEDGSYYLNGATTQDQLLGVEREPDAIWVIPSEDEWYKAAYHYNDGVTGNYYDYPTSSNSVPSNVLSNPAADPGNSANFWGDAYTIGSPYYRTVVGDFENSASPYGTYDQGGNVGEWNEAAIVARYRGRRGGSFFSYGDANLHAAFRSNGVPPTDEKSSIGFRVAKVPVLDFTGDGDVDLRDFAFLQADFGGDVDLHYFAWFLTNFAGPLHSP